MKNASVLTGLIVILLLFSAKNPVFCEILPDYYFSVGTHFGITYGQTFELVYPTAQTKGELLSELIWDMKPIFYLGLNLEYGLENIMRSAGFFASLSFRAGIPGDSGVIENRDWMSQQNGNLTHFSSHTNNTREFFMLDAAIGASIPIGKNFYIKPFLSTTWMHFAFTGRDGYGIYARETPPLSGVFQDINDNPVTRSFDGEDVIHYKQDWFIIAAGISAGTKMFYPFTFDVSFLISPLTYCTADDVHIERGIRFLDYALFGLYMEPRIKITFSIERFDLSLEAAYRYIGRTRGPSYARTNTQSSFSSSGQAGSSLSLYEARFLLAYRF
ncbi:MAG: omptin family outer membrane protease [Treponema sp.]|nr:omptin family outer membrane protease [Treponema sp.]